MGVGQLELSSPRRARLKTRAAFEPASGSIWSGGIDASAPGKWMGRTVHVAFPTLASDPRLAEGESVAARPARAAGI